MSVALVAAALLVCHGAFGYAHQLELTEGLAGPPSQAAHAHEAGGQVSAGHGYSGGTHPPGAYFATLLALFFGALLQGLPGRRFSRAASGVQAWSGRRLPSVVFHPPRGPTLPALQVFRL